MGGGEGRWVHKDYTPKEGMTYFYNDEADKKNKISILNQTAAAVAKEHPGAHNARKRMDEFAGRIGGGKA